MKHILIPGIAASLFVLTSCLFPVGALAQTNVVSRPVGFVRVEVPAQGQALVSLPFEPFDENINAVLAGQLTGGTNAATADAVLKWGGTGYEYAYKAPDGRWYFSLDTPTLSEMTIVPGEGFWLRNRQTFGQTVFLAGEVILTDSVSVSVTPSFNLLGYPFTSTARITDTSLAETLAQETQINALSRYGAGQYEALVSDELGRFFWQFDEIATDDAGFEMGRGYWYNNQGVESLLWTESRPYADAGMNHGGYPFISAMQFNGDKSEVALMIECDSEAGQGLDILSKEMNPTNMLDLKGGWQVLERDIPVTAIQISEETAQNQVTGRPDRWMIEDMTNAEIISRTARWTDIGMFGSGEKVNVVPGRYYVIGRADIDSDRDGVPDDREVYVYGTNPHNPDTDGDGMPDGWEIANGLNPLKDDSAGDLDRDGKSNMEEYKSGTSPQYARERSATIYVDAATGNDANDGFSKESSEDGGPKKSVNGAFRIAIPGDTVVVFGGVYHESVAVPSGVTLSASGDVRFE
jgi:hypothetical protein